MQSLRELYRIGRGPSSSHTMAPHRAAVTFKRRTPGAASYRVSLYGSLAATGRGHLTDRAIIEALAPTPAEILWKPEITLPYHPNGMKFEALSEQGYLLEEWIVYSVGGGALREEGAHYETPEVYPLANLQEAVNWSTQEGRPMWELAPKYEGEEIWDFMAEVWSQMQATMKKGLACEEVLPGGLRLSRRARSFYLKAKTQRRSIARTGIISSYALAMAEENASGGTVVTAPTCGSCGVVPAVLRYLKEELKCPDTEIYYALAVAGIVGNTAKHNASISGAEVGCQGEIGVACAMAAAAAAQLMGGTETQIEYAAEVGLEHFLGLTCDPVMGLVQIPCIERNALAANKAIISAEYVLLTDGRHRVSFDDVVKAMRQTGHDLPDLYRETGTGGLASIVQDPSQKASSKK
ncbi:MAG: L-serine ammonia-lyase, iron-sulfur-dependent, subunit alpha [Limisphaerales bacterium]|jgi:L-serine dehydratase